MGVFTCPGVKLERNAHTFVWNPHCGSISIKQTICLTCFANISSGFSIFEMICIGAESLVCFSNVHDMMWCECCYSIAFMVLWECFEYPFVSAFVWRACVCVRFDLIFPILMRQTNAIHLIFVHILITHCNFLICAMDWHRICCTHKKVDKTFGTNGLAHILQSNS